ncbi:uncharacterized protein LOC108911270 [Anoplophora glabripennis]|uniref:Uncharacterized protein n=1 Tax=Anoplophora glabripennis TaxID=217634 RepID=V5GY86_ANOGL|nr:uncharacterized protein LOC108911270 [Anoplophora glabripennis]
MATFVPYALALLLALSTANALKCYNCNSKDSATCSWGLTSFTYNTEECASAGLLDSVIGPKCYKIAAENKEGGEYIARGCLPPGTIGCNAIASAIGWISSQSSNDADSLKNLNCYTCDSDKCNSAQRLTGVTFIGLILAAAIFLF